MVKFSVVIPLYNKEKEIKETIDSVLSQTYRPDEVIVVNDGSTDKSKEIVQDYFKGKVKLINQENKGVSSARNRGIQRAKNEYIALIDGDDLWERDFLAEIKNLIEEFPEAVFYSTSHKVVLENGTIVKRKIPLPKGLIVNFPEIYRKYYGIINSSSVCIRKSIFERGLTFPEREKKGEDVCYWLNLSLLGPLAFSPKTLSIRRLNASNRSNKIHKDPVIPCQLKWFYKNRERLKMCKSYRSIKKFIYSNTFINTYGFVIDNNRSSINAILEFMKKQDDYFYIFLLPALFVPPGFLKFMRKIRRSIKSINII